MLYEKKHTAGPYRIEQTVAPGIYAWCSCGWSSNQPFCDGSHRGTGPEPVLITVLEISKIAWCACKRTQKPPYCDGSERCPVNQVTDEDKP